LLIYCKIVPLSQNHTSLKTRLFALVALFFTLALLSCHKKPNASFSTDKDVYAPGGRVYLTNRSTDGFYYTWIVKGPNQEEIRGSKKDFSFDVKQAGNYVISLTVYSENGKQVSHSTKTIESKDLNGSVIFYTTGSTSTYYYSVYAGSNVLGYVSPRSSGGVPSCGALNCYTYSNVAGTYVLTVINSYFGASQTYTVNIMTGVCQKQAVNF